MPAQLTQDVLGLFSGSLVGFSLGLVGGGGSILAVPLMVYLVGVPSAHVAIGTSALAVATNAAANLVSHARMGNVKWPCAVVFAASGVVGAFGGSSLSKIVDGQKLLALFAILMLIVAIIMFVRRSGAGKADVRLNRENLPRLLVIGLLTGALAGFFGIGGGFLIVPGLIAAAGMPIINAIGSSLVSVTAFGSDGGIELRGVGVRRLAPRHRLYCRRRRRWIDWRPHRQDPRRTTRRTEHDIRGRGFCGRDLHADSELCRLNCRKHITPRGENDRR